MAKNNLGEEGAYFSLQFIVYCEVRSWGRLSRQEPGSMNSRTVWNCLLACFLRQPGSTWPGLGPLTSDINQEIAYQQSDGGMFSIGVSLIV